MLGVSQLFSFFLSLVFFVWVASPCTAASLKNLWKNPSAHKGESVRVGGKVLSVRRVHGARELEVLEEPMVAGSPLGESDRSLGRFLVRVSEPPPQENAWILVQGRVVGAERGQVGHASYLYPVITAEKVSYRTPRPWEVGYYYSAPGYPPWWGVGFGWGWPSRP
jgi:starvation-inducible outer membrane lipoprotein